MIRNFRPHLIPAKFETIIFYVHNNSLHYHKMKFEEIEQLALKISDLYTTLNKKEGNKVWTHREYLEGLMGDIGDLHKLMMAKRGYRNIDGDLDQKIAHELSDCLWSIIVISKHLEIDLEKEFSKNMIDLQNKLEDKLSNK
jgi:NTP pyrophosphatase (non-canonical NTP hydrolase)